MPVTECTLNSKPGFKWGTGGTCYTHDGTPAGRNRAKQLAVKQAIAAGATRKELEGDPELLRAYDDLATVDLKGVELLESGVTIHGVGSPPEGDNWTPEDLRAMAAAAQELEQAGEWRIAAKVGDEPLGRNKIGHDDRQRLASSVSPGEMPSVGWLTNQRVSDDGKKLLADVTDVPAKLAQLIKAKAYRTRSAELATVTSQKTGKKHPWVVSGLAWLGGKMPAVRTLDDVHALYEGDDAERVFVQYEDAGEANVDELRDAIATIGVDALRAFDAATSRVSDGRVDSRPNVAEKTYTDEQRRKFAEATGLEADKVTDDMLTAAGVTAEEPEEKKKDEPVALKLEDEALRKLEEKTNAADERSRRLEEDLRVERRTSFVDAAIKDCKIEPGQREYIELMYDANPEKARKYVEEMPVNEDLKRELGSDGDDGDLDDDARKRKLEDEERDYAEDFEQLYGTEPMKFGRTREVAA